MERWHEPGESIWQATWIDATSPTRHMHCADQALVHVLWSEDDTRAAAAIIAGTDGDEEAMQARLAPGDTVWIPASTAFALGPGALSFVLSASPLLTDPPLPKSPERILAPTHGLQLFHRYNRRTICAASTDVVLERWKLTHTQEFRLEPARWHVVVNLVDPVALAWPGGSTLTSRATSYFLPPGMSNLTVVPDNLGYLLMAYRPDLARDVIDPLRAAGYDPETIASIGVPRQFLGR